MAGCCILVCGGFDVSTLGSCAGGGSGTWVTDVFKMADSCLRDIFCFSPRCVTGMGGVGFCSASVRSAAALVTASAGDRLGKFLCTRNNSVVSYTRSYAFLVM